ncbi:MAG: cyclodeaminase/cyclohydrolase family protein [Fermentimonas sp.]|nr:cyclodeaminase/cyclohydrolase family protein [Fermentimonas sp.]
MKLQDLTIKEFLEKTASNEPLPGGGCSSAMMAAIAAALTEMVANLTIGRKKYAKVDARMKFIAKKMAENKTHFMNDIDRDAVAYRLVMDAYKLPKNSDEEIAIRNKKIQYAARIASIVPMELAQRAYNMHGLIDEVLKTGNVNAVTDGKVALLACRAAIKGALLNVRTNLDNIEDKSFVDYMIEKCNQFEKCIQIEKCKQIEIDCNRKIIQI